MRALLVFNPNATTTDHDVRDVIASALASRIDLDIHATKQRGHATHIVAGAVHEGIDAVFALGGDGTANEVIQALAGTDVLLGVVPGGSTNVLARALGLPNDSVAATRLMLDKLVTGDHRRIGLGVAGTRYFAFNAGFGFDAAVVRLVERRYRLKRAVRQLSFVWCALQEWFLGSGRQWRQDPPIRVKMPGGPDRGRYGIAVVGNADPYTYLGGRAMRLTPEAAFERGLDLMAVRAVTTPALLRIVLSVFTTARHARLPAVDYWVDQPTFTLESELPQPLMVDGDYAGEHTSLTFTAVPDALSVLA